MRKRIVSQTPTHHPSNSPERWLDLEQIATVEVTSEDPGFPRRVRLSSEHRAGLAGFRERETANSDHFRSTHVHKTDSSSVRRPRVGAHAGVHHRVLARSRWPTAGDPAATLEFQSGRLDQRSRRFLVDLDGFPLWNWPFIPMWREETRSPLWRNGASHDRSLCGVSGAGHPRSGTCESRISFYADDRMEPPESPNLALD
jgi:hypothetical protein